MATEPTVVKSALAGVVIGALGAAGGEWALVAVGAVFGAFLALSKAAPMTRWWQPLTHLGGSITAGLAFAGLASVILTKVLPESWGLSTDLLWIPVATAIARYWREADALIPKLLRRKVTGDDPTP